MSVSRVMEYLWLVLAIVCLALGVISTFDRGISQSYPFFLLTLLALAMYYLRRKRNRD